MTYLCLSLKSTKRTHKGQFSRKGNEWCTVKNLSLTLIIPEVYTNPLQSLFVSNIWIKVTLIGQNPLKSFEICIIILYECVEISKNLINLSVLNDYSLYIISMEFLTHTIFPANDKNFSETLSADCIRISAHRCKVLLMNNSQWNFTLYKFITNERLQTYWMSS